jgi:hypothetical protein
METYWYSDDKGWCCEGVRIDEEVGKPHNSFVHVAIFHVENFLDYFVVSLMIMGL